MSRAINGIVFNDALLPEGERRWSSFSVGLVLQVVALAIILVIPVLIPQRLTIVQHYWVMPLEAPLIEPWKPQPRKQLPVKREVVKEIPKPKLVEVVVPKPKIYTPVITAPVAKATPRKVQTPEIEVAKVFPDQNPLLSLGSSAPPTLKKPREAVQTGGFGDPNGVPDNGKTNRNPNITQLGSFDSPPGAGTGNGSGGAKGEKGVIASAGFGDSVAVGTSGANHGAVKQGLFDERAVAGPRMKQTAAVSNSRPVEILFKPKPAYTDEARSKKIEGEVLLQVVFTSSGEVRVERVVQGLGYGLDASAESAARQIRFRPAQQEGQPVDSNAIVHITFQMTY
jgi:periplasmic protein TonB